MDYWDLIELDDTGSECCDFGTSCDFGVGCNRHALRSFEYPFNLVTNTSNTVSWNGSAGYDASPPNCVPPGNINSICTYLSFTSSLISSQADVIVSVNESFTVLPHSVQNSITITDWPFDPASTGLRLDITIMSVISEALSFTTTGNDVSIATYERTADIHFAYTAKVDGTQQAITFSGPTPHPYNTKARIYTVDFPKFTSYAEYSFFTRIDYSLNYDPPTASQQLASSRNQIILIAGCSGGGVVLCICCMCVIHWRHKKRQSEGKSGCCS